jgi:Protein of unknown function (DUF2842)
MTQRQRKFAGTIILLVMIAVYCALALGVAIVLQMQNVSKLGELIFYAVAGLLWVVPAGVIVKWMQKADA